MTMANSLSENTPCLRKRSSENWSKYDDDVVTPQHSAHLHNKRPKYQHQQHHHDHGDGGRVVEFSWSSSSPTMEMTVDPSPLPPPSLLQSAVQTTESAACYTSVMASLGFKMA